MASMFDFDPLGDTGIQMRNPIQNALRKAMRPQTPSAGIDYPDLSVAEEDSLLSQLSSGALSGLSYVGGMLDKFTGSRALRGAIAGRPRELLSIIPGSDMLGITNRADIASGKDVLRMKDDPNSWGDDIASFATEMLLDPTLFVGGFIKGGATQAGKLAKSANVFDDAVRLGSKAAQSGPRVGAMKTTLRSVVDNLDFPGGNVAAYRKLATAAKGSGMSLTDDILDMPLGGALEMRLPFTGKHLGTIGKAGDWGESVASVADKAGEALRWGKIPGTDYSPGMHAAQLFSASSGGLGTREGQEIYGDLFRAMPGRKAAASEPIYAATQKMIQALPPDQTTQDIAFALREYAETGALPPGVQVPQQALDAMDEVKRLYPQALSSAQTLGRGHAKELEDQAIDYWTRYLTDPGPKFGGGGAKVFTATTESDTARKAFLKNLTGGTATIREMAKQFGGNPATDAAAVKAVFGNMAPQHTPDDWNALASFLRNLSPEQVSAGVFGNHPMSDALSYFTHAADADAMAGGIYDLATKGLRAGQNLAPGTTVPLDNLLNFSGLHAGDNTGGWVYQIGKRMGLDMSDPAVYSNFEQTLKNSSVSKPIANDILKLSENFKAPKEVGQLRQAYDSMTNLFKAGVLTWPSRYVRDFTSGQAQNILAGQFNPSDVAMAKRLIGGEMVDATDIPFIQDMVAKSGKPLNPQTAYDALQVHLASMGITNPAQQSMAQIGNVPTGPGSIQDLAMQLPGESPITLMGAAKKAIPQSWSEANPLAIRGVGNQTETAFAPVKAGNDLGAITDSTNRLAPYLTLLRQGVDPAEARARVMASQVDYSNRAFTPFEREAMMRVAPFYRFSKGMAQYVLPEIADNPSGNLAQAIRGTARMDSGDDQFVPEHLQQSMSIPLPGAPEGSQRFLTGLGMMYEDPLNLFRPGQNAYGTVRGTGQELLGRVNPLLKAPLELFTDRQFFSGRELQDLDSSIGRTISNLGITEEPPDVPILLDQALSNSPASRLLSTVRSLSDSRKGAGVKALNLGTGVRITDVDREKAKNIAIREAIEQNLRGQGGVNTLRPHLFVRPEDWDQLSDREKALYTLYTQQAKESQERARKAKLGAKK